MRCHAISFQRLARPFGIGLAAGSAIGLAYGLTLWFWGTSYFPIDSGTYWLAGLRLDTGGRLYDLRPSDYWWPWAARAFPLYGPPLMGAVGRGLVTLGPWSLIVWTTVAGAAGLWAVLMTLAETRGWAGLLLIPLTPAVVLLIGVGNADGLVLAAILLAWLLRHDDRATGLLLGFAASLKLTPATLLVWLLVTRRWRALSWAAATCVTLAILTVLATEPGIFVRYAGVMVRGTVTGRSSALIVLVVGFALMALVRRSPALAFAIAVALIPLGSPQAAAHSWAVFLIATPALAAAAMESRWLARMPNASCG